MRRGRRDDGERALTAEILGRAVRAIWVAWAREQPDPKPSWLVPWEGLGEPDREVDRRIGLGIFELAAKPRDAEIARLAAALDAREREVAALREQARGAIQFIVDAWCSFLENRGEFVYPHHNPKGGTWQSIEEANALLAALTAPPQPDARDAEIAALREVLTACEWGDLTSDGWGKMIERCPICDHRKEHGHGKDCVLAAALAAPAQPPATGEGA